MKNQLPTIKLDSFEGPFDLLLELARKRKVDLSEISLKSITNDFLQYISQRKIPALLQGDFLVVAATLALLKVRSLLPSLTAEEEEEISSLTDRIRIYQLYREQAEAIQASWGTLRLLPAAFWSQGSQKALQEPVGFPDMNAEDIATLFKNVTTKIPKPANPTTHLVRRGRSLSEWLQLLDTRLSTVRKMVFQKTLKGSTPQDAAISFMAVLELARNQSISIQQDTPFSEITVAKL